MASVFRSSNFSPSNFGLATVLELEGFPHTAKISSTVNNLHRRMLTVLKKDVELATKVLHSLANSSDLKPPFQQLAGSFLAFSVFFSSGEAHH